jgi:hypothetical protein
VLQIIDFVHLIPEAVSSDINAVSPGGLICMRLEYHVPLVFYLPKDLLGRLEMFSAHSFIDSPSFL